MMRLTSFVRFAALPAILLLALAIPSHAHAQGGCITPGVGCSAVPEMDPALAGQGVALIAGAVFLVRSRRKS